MKKYTAPLSLPLSVVSVNHEPTASLWYMLHTVADHRRAQGMRHPLPVILCLGVMAVCCGNDSYEAMAEWAMNYQTVLRAYVPFLAGHIPDPSTFQRVFSGLDIEAFEQVLREWVMTVAPPSPYEGVAIDGKTTAGNSIHLVAAFSHTAHAVLFQKATTTKGQELIIGPQVIKSVTSPATIITGDALYAQKAICETIVKQGGGYVFTVKGNQRSLQDDIAACFDMPPFGAAIQMAESVEKNRGRVEKRTIEATQELNDYLNWPGLTHVWRVRREITHGGQTTAETALGIASLPQRKGFTLRTETIWLQKLIRGHWSIENGLHHTRDVSFHEDASTIRKKNAPQVMAALRNLVITLFNKARLSTKKTMRKFAACPSGLLRFLGLIGTRCGYA